MVASGSSVRTAVAAGVLVVVASLAPPAQPASAAQGAAGPDVAVATSTATWSARYTRTPVLTAATFEVTGRVLVNSTARVAGTDYAHAFRWYQGTAVERLGWGGQGGLSQAIGLNGRGQVAGNHCRDCREYDLTTPDRVHAFVWNPGAGLQDLGDVAGFSFARVAGINARGQVAGTAANPDREVGGRTVRSERAFLWDPITGMRSLGRPRGFDSSAAIGVNDAGQVVGVATRFRDGLRHGFRWDPRAGMKDLGAITPVAINARGQVLAQVTGAGGVMAGVLWDPSTGRHAIGRVSGLRHAVPVALNDLGQVTGMGYARWGSPRRAFRWDPRTGMRDLGGIGPWGQPWDISNRGQVVGSRSERAFAWDPVLGMCDLGPGEAHSVNERGQVVGVLDDGRPVLWAPRVTIRVGALRDRTELWLDVDPSLGTKYWSVTLQRRSATGRWVSLPSTYRTRGARETLTVDLPRGTYRALVPAQRGFQAAASSAVWLRR